MQPFINEIIDKIIPLTKVLGLSSIDVKVYITLLMNGPLTARKLAELLSISVTKTYEPLNRLIKKGFVEKSRERPAVYYAKPPREVWSNIKREVTDLMEFIENYIIPQLEAMASIPSQPYQITIIPQGSIIREIVTLISKSKSDVDIAISFPELVVNEVINAITDASKDKRVRVLVTSRIAKLFDRLKNGFVHVKILDDMFGSGVIGDTVILIVKNPSGTLNAMWSSHKYFNEIARVYFNHLWSKAKEI